MKGARKDKTNREFWAMCFSPWDDIVPTHVRVPNVPQFGISVIGTASQMHGPDGCCSCCPRRVEEAS